MDKGHSHRPKDQEKTTSKYVQKVALAIGIAIGFFLLLTLVYFAMQILFLAFAGVLLCIVIRAASNQLVSRTKLPDTLAVSTVFAVTLALFIGVGVAVAPQFSAQIGQFQETVPDALDNLSGWIGDQPWGRSLNEEDSDLTQLASGQVGELIKHVSGLAYGTVNVIASGLVVGFVAIFLSFNPTMYIEGFFRLIPFSYRPRARNVFDEMSNTLRRWLFASFIKMAAVGIMTFVGLLILDIPLAFFLAVIAFFLDFIPYFGPIFAAVPAVLIAFTDGPEKALWVVAMYTVVQQLESLVLGPILFQKTVYMPPVVTILAQILLALLAGVLGILLATPLTAVALVSIKMIYVEDILGDELEEFEHSERPAA